LPNSDELARIKGISPQGHMTHKEVIKMLLNIGQTNFDLGEKFEYSNTGYELLAEIIERVGGKPFNDQLTERIFQPLGMNNSAAIPNGNTIIKNKAYSYRMINETYVNHPIQNSTVGSGGISATINDMIIWMKNYQNPIVGSRTFFKRLEQPTYLNSGKDTGYGNGLYYGNYKGLEVVFCGGGSAGYRSYILHIPDHKLSVMILANTNDFTPLDIVHGTIDILLKDEIKVDNEKVAPLSSAVLKEYEGTYQVEPGVFYNIIAEKDSLYFQSYGEEDRTVMPYLGGGSFKFLGMPHSKFVFDKNKFDFHIADFIYEGNKRTIAHPEVNELSLIECTGIFKNEDHQIIYELFLDNKKLFLVKPNTSPVELTYLSSTSFYSKYFGQVDFNFNANNKVTSLKISGQNFKNIVFVKQ